MSLKCCAGSPVCICYPMKSIWNTEDRPGELVRSVIYLTIKYQSNEYNTKGEIAHSRLF